MVVKNNLVFNIFLSLGMLCLFFIIYLSYQAYHYQKNQNTLINPIIQQDKARSIASQFFKNDQELSANAKAYMKPIEDVNGTKAATIYLPKGKRLYDEKSLKEISSDILEAD